MSSNRQGLRRNVRKPWRYANSENNIGKRNSKGTNGNNNGIEKEVVKDKEEKVNLNQNNDARENVECEGLEGVEKQSLDENAKQCGDMEDGKESGDCNDQEVQKMNMANKCDMDITGTSEGDKVNENCVDVDTTSPNSNVSPSTLPVNVQCETVKTRKVDSGNNEGAKPSYADLAKDKRDNGNYKATSSIVNNAEKVLTSIPTEMDSNGISALASRIGRPMIMDNVTANMCKSGVGKVGFARVLIEVSAKKELPELVEVVYRNEAKEEILRKSVKVIYDWKPTQCNTRCVFGHTTDKCGKNTIESTSNKTEEVKNNGNETDKNISADMEGFQEVNYRKGGVLDNKVKRPNFKHNPQHNKTGGSRKGFNNVKPAAKYEFQPKKNVSKEDSKSGDKSPEKNTQTSKHVEEKGSGPNRKAWSVQGEILETIKRTSNKYSVLEMYDINNENELQELCNKEVVDEFLRNKRTPTEEELGKWDINMYAYYKKSMDMIETKGKKVVIEEDVYEDTSGIAQKTHVKNRKLQKIGDSIFGNWNWITNMNQCDKGCRIMIGWHSEEPSPLPLTFSTETSSGSFGPLKGPMTRHPLLMRTRQDSSGSFSSAFYFWMGQENLLWIFKLFALPQGLITIKGFM
ncbi:zinc knuckle CX2CX4HX4C [Artemisia annua]|uniref:Zinc knuckle CX2CX4HX4C n=1 Tax=Artemisia annua TaxID=35608 RepID=A0A2U1MM05_ARTAN|nr:zinc knuckle CX2CX4HX4C [Artemisia annua]